MDQFGMDERPVQLGDVAKDTISGFDGIVVCVSEWLYGCRRVTVQPRGMHEGQPIDNKTFDSDQLVVLKPRAKEEPDASGFTGGPRIAPTPHADPMRAAAR